MKKTVTMKLTTTTKTYYTTSIIIFLKFDHSGNENDIKRIMNITGTATTNLAIVLRKRNIMNCVKMILLGTLVNKIREKME